MEIYFRNSKPAKYTRMRVRAPRGSKIDVTAQVLQALTQNLLVKEANVAILSHNRKHHMKVYSTVLRVDVKER